MSAHFTFDALGTKWNIDVLQDISPESEKVALEQILHRVKVFNDNYSRFKSDSLLSQMSKVAGVYTLPDDAQILLDLYQDLYQKTEGKLTPMIGQVLMDAGYDPEYSLVQKKELEKPLSWDEVWEYSYPTLTIKTPTQLDFGALGKGYMIDLVGQVLEKNAIKNFYIDAGGDILYKKEDGTPMRVGLENPKNFEEVIGIAEVKNGSLCGSSGSRRAWQNFHHIIDPDSLVSPREVLATWTTAPTTLMADAMATCLFLVPPEKLTSWYNFEYVILYSDYSIGKSSGFPGEFFNR